MNERRGRARTHVNWRSHAKEENPTKKKKKQQKSRSYFPLLGWRRQVRWPLAKRTKHSEANDLVNCSKALIGKLNFGFTTVSFFLKHIEISRSVQI